MRISDWSSDVCSSDLAPREKDVKRRSCAAMTLALLALAARAGASVPADPLGSPMWEAHAKLLFGDDPVRFDPRVKVGFPEIAANQRSLPVALHAPAIPGGRPLGLPAAPNTLPTPP